MSANEWQANVLNYGLTHYDVRLFARLPGVFFNFGIGAKLVPDGYYYLLAVPLGTGQFIITGEQEIPEEFPHFPYGVNVRPN